MKAPLPELLLNDLEGINGFNRQNFIDAHSNVQPVTSVRFNKEKLKKFALTDSPAHPQFTLSNAVPWCDDGFYLDERPSFTLDPLLHACAYYVQ